MDTVQIAVGDHQWELVIVLSTLVCFVLGWSVFGWAK